MGSGPLNYTAGGFCGRTVDGTAFYDESDLRELAAAGHEIACHGFAHQPKPSLTDAELVADAARNREFLMPFLQCHGLASYAYPYGKASLRTKALLAPRFSSLRGVHPGLNAGRVDLAQLNTISLETRCWNAAKIEPAIQRAVQLRAWLVFYTHDVSESPSEYGLTPAMLDWALKKVAAPWNGNCPASMTPSGRKTIPCSSTPRLRFRCRIRAGTIWPKAI